MSTEDDFRLLGLANSYGTGTRSYNRSAQKREMDRQRKLATENYEHSEHSETIVGPVCHCRSFEFPHFLETHRQLRSEHDWRIL